MHTYKRKFM